MHRDVPARGPGRGRVSAVTGPGADQHPQADHEPAAASRHEALTRPVLSDLEVGAEVARARYAVRRSDLVRYAGAGGDFNPIHWDEAFARSVGLPDVLAHGMFTMATAVRVVTDWCRDPGAVLAYSVRFTKPVVVDHDNGATIEVVATVGALDPEAGTARIDLAATSAGVGVLGKARATVRLPPR